MEIVGIFDIVADKDDDATMYDNASIFEIIPIMLFAV